MFSGSMIAQTQKGKIHSHTGDNQTLRTCGTSEHHEFLKKTRPGYEKDFEEYNKMLDQYIENYNASATRTTPNITIPVVVHILYQNATENITDARAISQVAVLNEDFQKLNADTTIIPSLFKPVAGGTNITFCLAQRDPNGNPTTGIVHKATTVTSFNTNDNVKKSAQGGDDPWDVTKYVNIWVCDLGTSLLGYGEFPTGSLSNTYGLVLNYRYTGRNGGAQAPFNLGRTGTHEFGHCFNLFHIWGDDGTACTGSDQCNDTPNQKGENYGTPAFPQGTGPTGGCCSAASTSSMFMNYMDYTDDAGMAMFSLNQCTRIMAVVNTAPWNVLQTSNGCTPVNLVANDASVFNVVSPTGTACATSVTPVITLKNAGSSAMTSCTINYRIDAGTVNTYAWSGNLASTATVSVTLPAIPATAGTHTLTAYTSNPNGTTDGNATNDQSTSTFTVVAGGTPLPYVEGFESTTFPTTGMTIYNPDAGITWARTTTADFTGTASAFVDNYNYDTGAGQRDEMTLPNLDLSAAGSTQMTFEVAYTYWTTTGTTQYSDTLEVLASADCGATWTSMYKKARTVLATAPPVSSQTNPFIPSGPSQWRLETINLSPYDGNNNVMVKFRNISDYEDNLYLDDINIAKVIGIKENNTNGPLVNVYPNPTNGTLHVNISNVNGINSSEINLYNVIGEKVMPTLTVKGSNVSQVLDLSSLSNGVYQLETRSAGHSSFKKVIVNK
ncbi:MAG: C-terminal target protein [Bacteroidetes bacterium]|jgi:hypothetical protein|nr:C-terminal target protein [Bacteroidota bacterium]